MQTQAALPSCKNKSDRAALQKAEAELLSTKRCHKLRCKKEDTSGVRVLKGARQTMFKAQIAIKALRMYTLNQVDFDGAIKHQMILSQVRRALCNAHQEDKNFWADAENVSGVIQSVLSD